MPDLLCMSALQSSISHALHVPSSRPNNVSSDSWISILYLDSQLESLSHLVSHLVSLALQSTAAATLHPASVSERRTGLPTMQTQL